MSDEDLEVLITLDDPSYGPDEDTFHHLDSVTSWASAPFPIRGQQDALFHSEINVVEE